MQLLMAALVAASLVLVAQADVVDIVKLEPEPPPRPYSFKIRAGRYPGHVDRQHEETSDGQGTIRGSYSYVGPRQIVRTVEYVADSNGFHPLVHNPVQDTAAVSAAKARHSELFQKIAYEHAQIAEERAALRAAAGPVDAEEQYY